MMPATIENSSKIDNVQTEVQNKKTIFMSKINCNDKVQSTIK